MSDKEATQDKPMQKRQYQKPELIAIELAAEEVLSIGCKGIDFGFDAGSSPCIANTCASIQS